MYLLKTNFMFLLILLFTTSHIIVPIESKNVDTIRAKKIQADQFISPSLDFLGNEIANVALTNATIHGHLHHLAVHSLEIVSQQCEYGDLHRGCSASTPRLVSVDARGSLSTISNVKWDESNQALMVSKLISSDDPDSTNGEHVILVGSDLDLETHTLRNFQLEAKTILNDVVLEGGSIRNSNLSNVTFENLELGSVTVDTLSIKFLDSFNDSPSHHNRNRHHKQLNNKMVGEEKNVKDRRGSFLVIPEEGGDVKSSSVIHEERDSIVISTHVNFEQSVDFGGSNLSNLHITSGSIEGDEIDIQARNIQVNSITLLPYKESKRHFTNVLAAIDPDGIVTSSGLTMDNGWIEGYIHVAGDILFNGIVDGKERQGKLIDPVIKGGRLNDVKEISVAGGVTCQGGLKVHDDAYIDGSLTVSGSVLGSGPYVDVSDARFKTNIQKLSNPEANQDYMSKLCLLEAVSYQLNNTMMLKDHMGKGRKVKYHDHTKVEQEQIGFIAQEVQKVFPELVTERPDGYLGIQYSRFVPLIVEAMKDINDRVYKLEQENIAMRELLEEVQNKLG